MTQKLKRKIGDTNDHQNERLKFETCDHRTIKITPAVKVRKSHGNFQNEPEFMSWILSFEWHFCYTRNTSPDPEPSIMDYTFDKAKVLFKRRDTKNKIGWHTNKIIVNLKQSMIKNDCSKPEAEHETVAVVNKKLTIMPKYYRVLRDWWQCCNPKSQRFVLLRPAAAGAQI